MHCYALRNGRNPRGVGMAIANTLLLISALYGCATRREAPLITAGHGLGPATTPSVLTVAPKPLRSLEYVRDSSAAEQAAWIDYLMPRVLARAGESHDVFENVMLGAGDSEATGTSPVDRSSGSTSAYIGKVINDVVQATGRLGSGTVRYPPHIIDLPACRIVAVEVTFPSRDLSATARQGPLTICVWRCPSRNAALALTWLRSGPVWRLSEQPDRDYQGLSPASRSEQIFGQDAPGDRSFWFRPRTRFNGVQDTSSAQIQGDRLSVVGGVYVIEVSTHLFTFDEKSGKWLFFTLGDAETEIVGIARKLDEALQLGKADGVGNHNE
jgi:hypothetical protein